MGANNPRHNLLGKLGFRLGHQLVSYQKEAYPQTRVRPLPVSVIQALDTATQGTTLINIAIINVMWVSLFSFLRPGEYCKGGTNTAQQPIRLKEVQFFIGQKTYNAATVSKSVLSQADFVSLLFVTQKIGVKGKSIGHRHTGDSQGCPVAAMRQRVSYL